MCALSAFWQAMETFVVVVVVVGDFRPGAPAYIQSLLNNPNIKITSKNQKHKKATT
jgi:hypothetical protein